MNKINILYNNQQSIKGLEEWLHVIVQYSMLLYSKKQYSPN